MNYKNNTYAVVNIIFVIIIGIVLGYSYFFYPNNQPINCVVKETTGKACSSCGFSRAFSSFTHLQFTEGNNYNQNAFACYLFFIFQFVLRGVLSLFQLVLKTNLTQKFLFFDLLFTIILFLVAFIPLL